MRKLVWLPMVAAIASGCAVSSDAPGQKVTGVYAYEVGSGSEPKPSSPREEPEQSEPEAVEASPARESDKAATAPPETVAEPSPEPPQSNSQAEAGQSVSPAALMSAQTETGEIDIQPGQCWVYAQIQPRPVQESVQVKVRDSEVRLDVTPAEFRRGVKKVVTREGTKTYRVKAATYKEVTEEVLVKPETTRLVIEPAVYEEVEEEVVLEAARTELEPCRTSGAVAYGNASPAFGFCAVEIPARTKTVNVTKLVKPETTRTEVIPAEYKTVTRWVVDQPAQVIPVKTDDEIEAFEVSEVVEQPQTRETAIPAETLQMNVKRYEGKPRIVARQAVCDRNLTRDMVREMQEALVELGYDVGEIDGLPGPDTIDALTLYQVDNGLASGAITIETAERLGVLD
ncbi:peptidoglycan-binding domain-containing protein [Marinobacter vinifirmus]|uniref:peptidoglycan-binding domain-containing protein n=1 Tax=Marinobacter vinifirmus TaxID=355591 RepID=UPI00142E3FC0|nr:peptidoglycan-binding domain-containing protein [Marinobacter vinifirmus]